VSQGVYWAQFFLLIFINDINSVCHGQTYMKLFADDAKLYCEIDLNGCSLSLQTSLNNLTTWAFAWQLSYCY